MVQNSRSIAIAVHLPKLLEHMGAHLRHRAKNYMLYDFEGATLVVLWTEAGYRYYDVRRPEEKLEAHDLILQYISKREGQAVQSVWHRVKDYYAHIENAVDPSYSEATPQQLHEVGSDFNHFDHYKRSSFNSDKPFYKKLGENQKFKNRIAMRPSGEVLFPLFNLQNEVCGYFTDSPKGVVPLAESAIDNSLWYSNIPEKIEWLILFTDPKEAIAFDQKFRLHDAVYLALGSINTATTKILFQLQRMAKVKKLVLSFTGSQKIEGYLRDLHLISFLEGTDFRLRLTDKAIEVNFQRGEEKAFAKCYNQCMRFNEGLKKSYLEHHDILDQHLINQYSLLLSQEEATIQVRIPLEVNAIKYFVWSYYKNYLNKSLEVLKPKYPNWYMEWEASQEQQNDGKEVQMAEYRMAL